jgi:hypothetical protein
VREGKISQQLKALQLNASFGCLFHSRPSL